MMKAEALLVDRRTMAGMLDISERHLFDLTKDGVVPCIRLGRSVKYDPADVVKALKRLACLKTMHQPL